MVQVRPDGALAPASTQGPRVEAPRERGAAGALDLHEGISPPELSGCGRWPEALRLLSQHGELVRGRCKASNLCPYCRILAVVETAEMLSIDALDGNAPSLWIVLTAREHLTRPDTYRHLEHLRRTLRRRWPAVEWFVQVEFQKRGALHLNLLVKGVPTEAAGELLDRTTSFWCRRVDALPVGQHIEAIGQAEAVTRYLQKELAHGLKREQAPPIGWKGHRTSQTRGYFVTGAAVMRRRAKESLRAKRAIWRATEAGLSPHDAELAAHEELRLAAQTVWVLANDRGARVGEQGHDRGRMVLPSDRLDADVALARARWLLDGNDAGQGGGERIAKTDRLAQPALPGGAAAPARRNEPPGGVSPG